MAMRTSVSLEEYLKTTYHPDKEYAAGQLVERHVGEHDHSFLQHLLSLELGGRARERRFRVFVEQRVRISDEPRYRIPDVCVKALPYHTTPVLIQPDLAIEIVSPDDAPVEMLEKVAEYQAAGIPYIWVVDPYKRSVIGADRSSVRKPAGLTLATPLVGEVHFAALFGQLDEASE